MKVDLAKSIDTQKVGFLHPYLISLLAGFYTSVIHPPDFWNTSNTTEYVFPKSFFHFACLSGSISILRVSEFLNDLIHYLHPKAIPQLHKMATGWQALVFWSHDMTWKISFWDGKIFKGELLNLQGVWFRNKNLPPSEPARSGRPQKGSWAVRSAPEPQKGWWAVRSALEPQKDSRAVHSCPEPSAKVSSDLEVERSFHIKKKTFKVSKGRNKNWEKLFPQLNITKQNISEIKWTVPHQKKNEMLHMTCPRGIVSICWSIYFLAWIFPQKIQPQHLKTVWCPTVGSSVDDSVFFFGRCPPTSWIQDLSLPLWDTLTLCAGWKMDPDCRCTSGWKWRYSSRPCWSTRG